MLKVLISGTVCFHQLFLFPYTLRQNAATVLTLLTLFLSHSNLRAVCVYRMSDIVRVFTSNELKDRTETFSSPLPGEVHYRSLNRNKPQVYLCSLPKLVITVLYSV